MDSLQTSSKFNWKFNQSKFDQTAQEEHRAATKAKSGTEHKPKSPQVSQTRLQELRLATQSDLTLKSLTKIIYEGWPQSKKNCPKQLLEFWNFRQEIS